MVEFMQGNSPMPGIVLDDQGGRFRIYARSHKEVALAASRLLPWSGPSFGAGLSRQDMDNKLDEHWKIREELAASIDLDSLWELAQGEVEKASAGWLASLVWANPSIDHEAAIGRRLLAVKTHFRFTSPDFEILPEHVVEQRMEEEKNAQAREEITRVGAIFFQLLWDIFQSKRGPLTNSEEPESMVGETLKEVLRRRISEPENDQGGLWKQLTKGIPEHPHMALVLATAWRLVPEHYNFWLDRAGYEKGDAWAEKFSGELAEIRKDTTAFLSGHAPEDLGFISIDPETTQDRDDACLIERRDDGSYRVQVAVACPAVVWPFEGPLDKEVLRRTSSIYLPEGDEHMLPPDIGWEILGLDSGSPRPAMIMDMSFDPEGNLLSAEPRLSSVIVQDNLFLNECEGVFLEIDGAAEIPDCFTPSQRALSRRETFRHLFDLAKKFQAARIANGAVITERPDPEISLGHEGGRLQVYIENKPEPYLTHMVVGEMMIAANSAFAAWGMEREIPLFFRTQDVALPREYAGVWKEPHLISKIVRSLPGAVLETLPRRHAGLGLPAYVTLTSPLRRYTDLFNQGQVLAYLQTGKPRLGQEDVNALLPLMSARQDAVNQIQRMRPRYWKLLFFRRHGDKAWWDGVVTEENEHFATVSLPWAQMFIRGRRRVFEDKLYPGQPVQIRVGKVNPLLNDIQILEGRETDSPEGEFKVFPA